MFEKPFAVGPQRRVSRDSLQKDRVRVFESREERRPHEPRRQTDERGVKQGPPQQAEVQRRRHDAQRCGKAGPPASIPLLSVVCRANAERENDSRSRLDPSSA